MPISEPPYDAPLALCDASSFSTDDLVNSFIAFTDYDNPESGKTFTVEVPRYVYNPNHRWAYFPEMKPGQALFFLGLEWTTDGEPRAVPHTSFFDPSCPPGSTPRNSVETRGVLVFDA